MAQRRRAMMAPIALAVAIQPSHVEVDAGRDATWIECRIIVNDQVVASHRSEGSNARAVCDQRPRLGPS